jgi:hypothetical protein
VISLQAFGSTLDRKRTCRSCIIAFEKLDKFGAPDGHACIISKKGNVMHLHPCKTNMVGKFCYQNLGGKTLGFM